MTFVRHFNYSWSFVGKHGGQFHSVVYSAELISLKFNFPKLANKIVSRIFVNSWVIIWMFRINKAWIFFDEKFNLSILSDWPLQFLRIFGPIFTISFYSRKVRWCPKIFQRGRKFYDKFLKPVSEDSRRRSKNFEEFK